MILCPLLPAFFSKFPIILLNIVLAMHFVTYLFFSLVLSFFFSFFVGVRVVFMIFFPHQAIFIPPPRGGGGGGGYFPTYRPLLPSLNCTPSYVGGPLPRIGYPL
jgi:hypothetical protein